MVSAMGRKETPQIASGWLVPLPSLVEQIEDASCLHSVRAKGDLCEYPVLFFIAVAPQIYPDKVFSRYFATGFSGVKVTILRPAASPRTSKMARPPHNSR